MKFQAILNPQCGEYATSNGTRVEVSESSTGLQYASLEEFLTQHHLMQFVTWLEQDRCRRRRAARYDREASVFDFVDAETKIASSDPVIQAEGVTQKAAVLAKRLQIKAEIPKPQ